MSKANKYVIRTNVVDGNRTRHYFASREEAREFCRVFNLPQMRIQKL